MVKPFEEGRVCKGGRNPPNTSDKRPPAPKGSGGEAFLEKEIPKLVRRWGMEAVLEELASLVTREKEMAAEARQATKYLCILEADLWDALSVYKQRHLEE